MFDLSDKVAVITGGASGIGLATARRFVAAGATVVVGDLSDATDIATELGGTYIKTDVADENAVEALLQAAVDHHGRLDIVLNNAGIAIGDGFITEQELDAYVETFKVNVLGVVHGLKHAPARMTRGGVIINKASLAGLIGFPGFGAYESSKWAVVGLTKTAAIELGPVGIRVNAVCPSGVETPMLTPDNAPAEEMAVIAYGQIINRTATAEEVAAAIHFLASDDASYITGLALPLDGGMMAGPSLPMIDLAMGAMRDAT